MSEVKKGLSRRSFLKGTGAALAGAALGGKFATQMPSVAYRDLA